MAQQSRTLSDKLKRIEVAAQKFPALSASLNTATDQLAKSVNDLDVLLKRFGFGIPVWFTFNQKAEEPYYDNEDIGYAKIGGRWGISIRTFRGIAERGNLPEIEQWLFNESPRHLRVAAAEKLPELMEALVATATNMEKRIIEKTADVQAVTETMAMVFDKIAPPRTKNTILTDIEASTIEASIAFTSSIPSVEEFASAATVVGEHSDLAKLIAGNLDTAAAQSAVDLFAKIGKAKEGK
jgi:hypothetical protein